MLVQDWEEWCRRNGTSLSLLEFIKLTEGRLSKPTEYQLPRGFDPEFRNATSPEELRIKSLSDQYRKEQTTKLETEVFTQRKRLVDAERKLATKETAASLESKRIASNKVMQAMGKLALLRDDKKHGNGYRIFPRSHTPIVLMQDGKKVMVPVRYLLRQPWAPALMDHKLSGNYNARRDNLTKFWKVQFSKTHAVMLVRSFHENVTGKDGQNQVLHFVPRPSGLMYIACLYSEWTDPKPRETLLSFTAVTDDLPAEVAAAGHDRMIVNLRPYDVDH